MLIDASYALPVVTGLGGLTIGLVTVARNRRIDAVASEESIKKTAEMAAAQRSDLERLLRHDLASKEQLSALQLQAFEMDKKIETLATDVGWIKKHLNGALKKETS